MTNRDEIHIWGDSLGRGVMYSAERGRYLISAERCDRTLTDIGLHVVNHSVMGRTAPQGLEAYRQAAPCPGSVCVVEYGGNDCDLDWPAVAAGTPICAAVELPAFEDALCEHIQLAMLRGERPLLVTPPPLHAERYFRWVCRGLDEQAVLKALGDVQHIYRWQERYANAVRRAAQRTGCALFDLRDAFLAAAPGADLYSPDGIHPNDEGYRLISQAVAAFLEQHHANCIAC